MLKVIQQNFQAYLKNESSDCVLPDIATGKPNTLARLTVYHNAYRMRLLETLQANFPKLVSLLGDEYFNQLGLAYLAKHPSTHFSIDQFGAKFPYFLKNYPNLHPAVAELAQFEWSLGEVITAADADSIDKSSLLDYRPKELTAMRCMLHPSVFWQTFEWQPMAIWNHLTHFPDENLPTPTQTSSIVCVFWRKNLQAYFRSLSPEETLAFHALTEGRTLAEICEILCKTLPEETVSLQFSQFLNRWIEDGFIHKLHLP